MSDRKRPVFRPPGDVLTPKATRNVVVILIGIAVLTLAMKAMGVGG